MCTERKIGIAFILNVLFAVFELLGGLYTGSIAVLSDAVHDAGDAVSIGISYMLEKVSQKPSDEMYTYGYRRYSAVGALITTAFLLVGSVFVTGKAVGRLFHPAKIHFDGMVMVAVVGLCVNLLAAFFTRDKNTINQKAVHLHMLEDVLGWAVVLAGAVVMRFTNLAVIDPLLSVTVSCFVFAAAIKTAREALCLLLEKAPDEADVNMVKRIAESVDGVTACHHVHIWQLDDQNICVTMHLVSNMADSKKRVKEKLAEHGIRHVTVETERVGELCTEYCCHLEKTQGHIHHHHGL